MKFEALERDFLRVSRARDILAAQCQQYRQYHKQWRALCDESENPELHFEELAASLSAGRIDPERAEITESLVSVHLSQNGSVSRTRTSRSASGQLHRRPQDGEADPLKIPGTPLRSNATAHLPVSRGSEPDIETSSGQGSYDWPRNGQSFTTGVQTKIVPLQQEENDSPVLVSARPLKRKRGVSAELHSERQNGPRIKKESVDSSPMVSGGPRYHLDIHDSLDLDEVGQQVTTPKKRKSKQVSFAGEEGGIGLDGFYEEEEVAENLATDAEDRPIKTETSSSNNTNPSKGTTPSIGSFISTTAASGAVTDANPLNRVQDCRDFPPQPQQTRARKAVLAEEEGVYNESVLANRTICAASGPPATPVVPALLPAQYYQDFTASIDRRGSEGLEIPLHPQEYFSTNDNNRPRSNSRNITPLQQLDPNVLPHTSNVAVSAKSNARRKFQYRNGDHGAAAIGALAEDGDFGGSSAPPRKGKARGQVSIEQSANNAPSNVEKPNIQNRLSGMLQKPTPEKADLLTPGNNQRRSSRSNQQGSKPARSISELDRTSTLPRTTSTVSSRSEPGFNTHSLSKDIVTANSRSGSNIDANIQIKPNNTSKKNHSDTNDNNKIILEDPPEVLPEHEPLRCRKVDLLKLADFKLNPNHSDYSHRQAIRKHDEAKMLSGCTDPFCDRCRELAAFAEISGFLPAPKPGLFDSSPPTAGEFRTSSEAVVAAVNGIKKKQSSGATSSGFTSNGSSIGNGNGGQVDNDPISNDEIQILIKAMGKQRFMQYKTQIRPNLSPNSRKRFVRDTRTALFADTYGKHRQAVLSPSPAALAGAAAASGGGSGAGGLTSSTTTTTPKPTTTATAMTPLTRGTNDQSYYSHLQNMRAVTPPGFWNADMPSTQQEAENREAARAMERERIQERYFEALRGGIWKFADE